MPDTVCCTLPESRSALHELEQQAIWRMQRWRVANLLYQWRSHALSCKAGRHSLQVLHSRNQRRRQALTPTATQSEAIGAVMMLTRFALLHLPVFRGPICIMPWYKLGVWLLACCQKAINMLALPCSHLHLLLYPAVKPSTAHIPQ